MPDGVCIKAHWTATKSSADISSMVCGNSALPFKDPSDPTFVAYDNITEAQAVDWVQSAMGQAGVDELTAKLDADILAKTSPAQKAGVPWQTTNQAE